MLRDLLHLLRRRLSRLLELIRHRRLSGWVLHHSDTPTDPVEEPTHGSTLGSRLGGLRRISWRIGGILHRGNHRVPELLR